MRNFERERKIRDVSVNTLNTLKWLTIFFPVFCIIALPIVGIPFGHTELGDKIVNGIGHLGFYYFIGVIPFYWCLLIVQFFMTITWNNKRDYDNPFAAMSGATRF